MIHCYDGVLDRELDTCDVHGLNIIKPYIIREKIIYLFVLFHSIKNNSS
jgi:hypothetical protein